jgi:DNA-binding transcriptional MocR family regulator
MNIKLDRTSSSPIYLQISNSIQEMILSGNLEAGFRLPPERKLAEQLQVNRSTVLNAYRELKANNLVDSHIGQGTTVVFGKLDGLDGRSNPPVENAPVSPMPWEQLFSESSLRSQDTTVRDLLRLSGSNGMILFAAGVTVPGIDSLDALQRVQTEVLRQYGHTAVQHIPTEGFYPLRESIGTLMKERGIHAEAEDTVVLAGSQQGLDLTARVFLDPGDVVFVEEPSFFSAFHIFKAAGARVVGVPADRDGMRTDILAMLLERYRPKLIYTIPDFQNPAGCVMSLERRKKLLSLAYRHQAVILEDDPYGRLRYEGSSLPPLKALDRYGYVIYLSTFSKLLFPGFRVGWVTASRKVLHRIVMLKQMADLHTSSLPQLIVDRFVREGLLEQHLAVANTENRRRRDVMLEALQVAGMEGLSWNRPEGGLYLWCGLPEGLPQSRLLARAVECGVSFVPGNAFYPGAPAGNHIRLNFTYPDPDRIVEGVQRLARAWNEVRKEQRRRTGISGTELGPIV